MTAHKILHIFTHKKTLTILIHTSVWSFFFFMPHILYDLPIDNKIILMRIIELSVLLSIFYWNALFLVPRFLIPKKYIRYFGIVLLIIISISQAGAFATAHYFPRPDFSKSHSFESF